MAASPDRIDASIGCSPSRIVPEVIDQRRFFFSILYTLERYDETDQEASRAGPEPVAG